MSTQTSDCRPGTLWYDGAGKGLVAHAPILNTSEEHNVLLGQPPKVTVVTWFSCSAVMLDMDISGGYDLWWLPRWTKSFSSRDIKIPTESDFEHCCSTRETPDSHTKFRTSVCLRYIQIDFNIQLRGPPNIVSTLLHLLFSVILSHSFSSNPPSTLWRCIKEKLGSSSTHTGNRRQTAEKKALFICRED